MPFKKFPKRYAHNIRKGNFVSITKSGKMGFPLDFKDKYLADFAAVELYFDRERKVIGLKPTKEIDDTNYEIKSANRKGGGPRSSPLYFISITAFLGHYEIDYSESRRYSPKWNEEHQLVEIDLNRPI